MGAGAIPGMMQGMPMGQTMAQQGMPMMGSGMQMPMGQSMAQTGLGSMMRPMMPRFGGMMPMNPMGMRMPGYMMAQTESEGAADATTTSAAVD